MFTHEPDGEIPYIQPAMFSCAMGNLVIYEETVKQKLANLNVNKFVGPDGIHPRFLRALERINMLKTVSQKRFIFSPLFINNSPYKINFSLDLPLKNCAR